MSRLVARAESFERVYDAFNNINFAAFDYDTIKQSLLDYVKLYFPETFNDFIESSEFIAIIETFAYIAELLAYRIDINSHENFISTAQRKDSILRLAKLISYTAARPLPARGLVKITSVTTTESVIDVNGNDLSGRKILWNDVSNPNWKDQFTLLMNRVMEQKFGTVGPTDRFQMQDVLFELYSWNLSPLETGVFSYTASASGQSAPMELVPIEYNPTQGIIERRPQNNTDFTILYGQDGLGDGSDTTGFFCYTKQGRLQRIRTTFDGVTPNQTYDVPVSNVNDIDVWVNNIDPNTNEILDVPSTLPYRRSTLEGKSGEWVQVDLAHAQNVIFNTNPKRNKYEVETRDENRIRLIFGDGEFADVPMGTFDVWVRSSLDKDVVVTQASVSNVPASFTYVDEYNRTQTFTFTFSLINSLQNGSAAEDIEHVRVTAPAVYYAQDRMVNAEDYNVFMLQDPSILKLRAINRTFAGESKYITWHDASGTYENVKLFGNDGIVYYQDKYESDTTPVVDINTLISTYIEPILSSTDLMVQIQSQRGIFPSYPARTFTTIEKQRIADALTAPPAPTSAKLYYNAYENEWYAVKTSDLINGEPSELPNWPDYFITQALITVDQNATTTKYDVARYARRVVVQSMSTSFWNTNDATRVIEYDTLNSQSDNIVILQANLNSARTSTLTTDWTFDVLGQEVIESGPNLALADIHRLSALPSDENSDGVPDNIELQGLLNADVSITASTINAFNNKTPGAGYNGGTFTNVPLVGGSGVNAKATITVTASSIREYDQTNIVSGTGYTAGYYYHVPVEVVPGHGTGIGARATIEITSGILTNWTTSSLLPGTGYVTPPYNLSLGGYCYAPALATSLTGVGSGAKISVCKDPNRGAAKTITPYGSNVFYEGVYTNVYMYDLDGTWNNGYAGTVDVEVKGIRSITTLSGGLPGSNYNAGTHYNIPFDGGTGTGAVGWVTVVSGGEITIGSIFSGDGYALGTYYNVPTYNVSGTGSGAMATVTVTQAGGVVLNFASTWNPGHNYVVGTYPNTTLQGDSGSVVATVVVTNGAIESIGSITPGSGYHAGTYYNVPLNVDSGAGTWATADVTVSGSTIGDLGSVTPGTLYTSGTYTGVALTGGSGSGAIGNIIVSGGGVTSVYLTDGGVNYVYGDTLSAAASSIGGTGSGFSVSVTGLMGGVTQVQMQIRGKGYTTGNILTASASALGGSGSGFSVPVASTSGGVTDVFITDGGTGNQIGDVFHQTYGDLNLWSGLGFSIVAANTTPPSGKVTGFDVTTPGTGYSTATILGVNSSYIGGIGSGFYATISNVAPYGRVTHFGLTSSGTGYSVNDQLSIPAGTAAGAGTGFTGYVYAVYMYGPVFSMEINNPGYGFVPGSNHKVYGGSIGRVNGIDAYLTVNSIDNGGITYISIAEGGSNYQPADILTVDSSLIGGAGTGFQFTVDTVENGRITSIRSTYGGTGFAVGDRITANSHYIGGTGSGFYATVNYVQGGVVSNPIITDGGFGYKIGDVLSIGLPAITHYTDAEGILTYGSGFSIRVSDIKIDTIKSPIYGILSKGDFVVKGGTGTLTSASGDPDITNYVRLTGSATSIYVFDYVYFSRASLDSPWIPEEPTPETMAEYMSDANHDTDQGLWKRHPGRDGLNFAWFHRAQHYNLIDPSPTNIIDMFVITKGYYTSLKRWLENPLVTKPSDLTPLDLRTSYGYLLDNRMISDTVVLHPGRIKLLFGQKAHPSLRATFRVVRSENGVMTDNQVKTTIVTTIRNFFDITTWEFGETFYATELFAAIHAALPSEINSVVIVPSLSQNQFGDLFQILVREDEVLYPDITVDNIDVVTGYTATNLRLNG